MADAVLEGKRQFEERLQAESDKESGGAPHAAENGEADVPESVETKGAEPGLQAPLKDSDAPPAGQDESEEGR